MVCRARPITCTGRAVEISIISPKEVGWRGGELGFFREAGRLGIANVALERPTEARGIPRRRTHPPTPPPTIFSGVGIFPGLRLPGSCWRARPPYVNTPEAQGSSRKLKYDNPPGGPNISRRFSSRTSVFRTRPITCTDRTVKTIDYIPLGKYVGEVAIWDQDLLLH